MTDQADLFGDNLTQLRRVTREKSIEPSGTKCPVCDQRVHRSRRRLNQGMARILIAMHGEDRKKPRQWIHLNTMLANTFATIVGDGTKLRHWGLIEKHPTADPSEHGSNSSGLYRITGFGHQFVERGVKVHSHGFAFNQLFAIDENAPLVDIVWCLGKGFDYHELMRETGHFPP